MKNTIKIFGIILFITVISFSFITCDDDDGNKNTTGTIQIKLTNIPSNVMTLRETGKLVIGIGNANSLYDLSTDIIVGRGTNYNSIYDEHGSDWYQFFLINNDNYDKFIGKTGKYDIVIIDMNNHSTWIVRNVTLNVNSLNIVSFSSFNKQ